MSQDRIISLLKKPFIFDSQLSEITPTLLLKIVEFRSDPREQEKETWREDDPEAWDTLLVPAPRFDEWEYRQILEEGVRPLADREPYQVARILIDAVASMVRLGMHQQDFDKGIEEDSSEVWCRKLNKPDRDYQDVRGILVQTLTYACEQVYKKARESIDAVDQALRNHRWVVFRRLRQYLYATHPNDQTLPWIREQILGHEDFSRWEHHYEFQLMIRKASEHFGPRLLSEDEKEEIFGNILSGPSREDYREWTGDRYSNQAFQKRRRYFHHKQLRPFATLLNGELRDYFDELEEDVHNDQLNDDSYHLYNLGTGGIVRYKSPKSVEDLQSLTDEELISYLNKWDQKHVVKDDWLLEINIDALAKVFQSLFKQQIVPNGERLTFWMQNRDRIARPIYITAMLNTMTEFVKEKKFDHLDQWIECCEWVLSHPDPEQVEGQPRPEEGSRDHPDWSRSRRAVVDFIDSCLSKDNEAPVAAKDGLAMLLQQVCTQPDWRLDNNRPVLLSQDRPITEAINNTRSRALDSLVNFAFWIRRALPEDDLSEVISILNLRIANNSVIPLTRPEYAILGMHFGNLCHLEENWAAKNRDGFFPRGKEIVWWDAFGSYLRFNEPAMPAFKILRDDFKYAIDNLQTLPGQNGNGKKIVNRLGQHLFTYFLWDVYPLSGDDESLLENFYAKTNDDRAQWADLFDYVGRSLKISDQNLEQGLIDRIIIFFDWRLQVAEPMELNEFTYWLEAECLEPEWRLKSFLKILDLVQQRGGSIYLQVKILTKFLPDHLALIVECFAKITASISHETQIHIPTDEAKTILKAGLKSENPKIKENAERALENLLPQVGSNSWILIINQFSK